jgi:hypothetical protein
LVPSLILDQRWFFVAIAVCASFLGGGQATAAPGSTCSLCTTARALVPTQSKIVVVRKGICVAGAPFPSCVSVAFNGLPATFAQRRQRALARAHQLHWVTHDDVNEIGEMISIRRGRLRGFIAIWRRPVTTCGTAKGIDCFVSRDIDRLQVTQG